MPRPAPGERVEREERHVSSAGRPDAVESQRAFLGKQSRQARVRGPTPRRGGAERERGGLSRLSVSSRDAEEYA